MADETVDLIEESNDEIENWLYYSKETNTHENNTNTYNDADAAEELIYVDSTHLVTNVNEQAFSYDCEDNELVINEGEEPCSEQNQEQQVAAHDDVDDLSKHNLILRETIDENGQLVQGYLCQQCNMSFSSIEDFLKYHPNLELLNEPNEQEEQKDAGSEDKLWDLVENLDEVVNSDDIEEIIEMKPRVDGALENDDLNNVDEFDKERYFCYDCQKVFTDLTTAENHDCITQLPNSDLLTELKPNLLEDNADNNVYSCHLCNKDYTSLRSFNNHQRWHKKSEDLLGHTKTLHEVAVVCEVCNTLFSSKKNLKLHMKMHKKQTLKTIQEALPVGAQSEYKELNQFFCEICNKSFDQKLLVIHKNMHQNLEEYSCGKCNKQFENLPSYEIHMQIHVDNNKKTNNITQTEEVPSTSAQSFSNDGSKRKHACQYCGKEFQRPYEKVKHERIHTGEKPYECEVCGKTFRVSYSLTLHLRNHTDIRPYVCATCNKRFKQQSAYVHHLKTHVVERDYKCDICGKSFRTSVQLRGHKNIHSKPYNCTECNRPFASLYSVKMHMKTHNKGHKSNKNLKNSCNICGASYGRLFALRFHLKEQHGIDLYPTQLLAATSADGETTILMTAANEANQQMQFISADGKDHEDDDVKDVNIVNEEEFLNNRVDHEENIENSSLTHNDYLDETEAATQAILNTQEISVDQFPTEEIITDWLSK